MNWLFCLTAIVAWLALIVAGDVAEKRGRRGMAAWLYRLGFLFWQKSGPGFASGAASLFRLAGGYRPTMARMVFWPCGEPSPPTRS